MQSTTHSAQGGLSQPLFRQMAVRMGVSELFEFQKRAISATLAKRDSFLVIPTGGGKSFCYTIPCLLLPGIVVVISPLISLMRDQNRQMLELDIPSLAIDSLMTSEEQRRARERILHQEVKIIFLSPERLGMPYFRELLREVPLALIAVDEAHCVHQWGSGFRPEYAKLGQYIDDLNPAPRMALTATVTSRERGEITQSLRMRDPELIVKPAPRENLELVVHPKIHPEETKLRILQNVRTIDGQCVIYGATRKNVEEIYHLLRRQGQAVGIYHGGMSGEERLRQQELFSEGRQAAIVATKAFGMGINLPHIRQVLHANMPCSIESYAQEIGRAGRDGAAARCELFYGPRDFYIQKFLIEKSFPSETDLLKVYEALDGLYQMRESYLYHEIPAKLAALTDLDPGALQMTLDFLIRHQLYQVAELRDEEHPGWESHMTPGSVPSTLDRLVAILQGQIAWRFEKLRAMHGLIKGASSPREYIEHYFA